VLLINVSYPFGWPYLVEASAYICVSERKRLQTAYPSSHQSRTRRLSSAHVGISTLNIFTVRLTDQNSEFIALFEADVTYEQNSARGAQVLLPSFSPSPFFTLTSMNSFIHTAFNFV
jgi:hypothetical protein